MHRRKKKKKTKEERKERQKIVRWRKNLLKRMKGNERKRSRVSQVYFWHQSLSLDGSFGSSFAIVENISEGDTVNLLMTRASVNSPLDVSGTHSDILLSIER